MRFVILIKATKDSEAGLMPSWHVLIKVTRFNDPLVNGGFQVMVEA